jgi:hypothetical protein
VRACCKYWHRRHCPSLQCQQQPHAHGHLRRRRFGYRCVQRGIQCSYLYGCICCACMFVHVCSSNLMLMGIFRAGGSVTGARSGALYMAAFVVAAFQHIKSLPKYSPRCQALQAPHHRCNPVLCVAAITITSCTVCGVINNAGSATLSNMFRVPGLQATLTATPPLLNQPPMQSVTVDYVTPSARLRWVMQQLRMLLLSPR